MNESATIDEFMSWCHEGVARAEVRAEILIVDSGSDDTGERALAAGARVLRTPKRGLGRAYLDAMPGARGRWVLMGDADCTYDFRMLSPFVERFRAGDEFVMGSRFAGSIEKGAMPGLHQHLGTPVTTWILNQVHGSHYSDIHCGMRGLTRSAWERLQLQSQSWEYASEMVLKAARMGLSTSEVPVHFLKDRNGRVSHHRRSGWTSPWRAAWTNMREMFVYGADFFAFWPGLIMLLFGLIGLLSLAGGPVTMGSVTFSVFWMLLFSGLAITGLSGFVMGTLARAVMDWDGTTESRWLRRFSYNRGVWSGIALVLAGIALLVPLVTAYVSGGLSLPAPSATVVHLAVLGGTVAAAGFILFVFTLVLHAVALVRPRTQAPGPAERIDD